MGICAHNYYSLQGTALSALPISNICTLIVNIKLVLLWLRALMCLPALAALVIIMLISAVWFRAPAGIAALVCLQALPALLHLKLAALVRLPSRKTALAGILLRLSADTALASMYSQRYRLGCAYTLLKCACMLLKCACMLLVYTIARQR